MPIPLEHRPTSLEPLTLSLVIPVHNEAEMVGLFVARVSEIFAQHPSIALEMVFINDGSTDATLECLLTLQQQDSRIRIVELSRNFGKEAALTAGLQACTGQVVVPIDVDLQDPPELIPAMVAKWQEGYDVVLAHRTNRDSDSWAKRTTAAWFYRLHNKIAEPKLPENVGDFRLMDRCVIEALNHLPESRRFMKGLFSWLGFRTAIVDYTRPERAAGYSKFNGWRLWNFAVEGMTSFSTAPLRVWGYLGLIVSLVAFVLGIAIMLRALIYGVDVPGYASLMAVVTFLGGVQLIGIGVIGEYLGRTYIETKRRPVYLIRKIYEPAHHINASNLTAQGAAAIAVGSGATLAPAKESADGH